MSSDQPLMSELRATRVCADNVLKLQGYPSRFGAVRSPAVGFLAGCGRFCRAVYGSL